jgi:hypothetical protein
MEDTGRFTEVVYKQYTVTAVEVSQDVYHMYPGRVE